MKSVFCVVLCFWENQYHSSLASCKVYDISDRYETKLNSPNDIQLAPLHMPKLVTPQN
jgi:hypothetical protein